MKKFSKILCLILAVALVCVGFVLAVSADAGTSNSASYISGGNAATADLATAISSADAGTTVKLEGDCTLTAQVKINKNITLDLNGYTLNLPTQNAFAVETASIVFTITGNGTINADGTFIYATATATVNVKGTGTGIKINHSGSVFGPGKVDNQNVGLIVYGTAAGTYNFENLDIVSEVYVDCRSSDTGNENNQRGAMFRTDEGTAGTRWNFNRVSFYRDADYDSQYYFVDAGAFLYMAGANCKATVNDCVIKNSGPIISAGYMRDGNNGKGNADPDFVFFEANNSHMEVILRDGSQRVNAFSPMFRTSEGSVKGTINLTNSYFGGQVYRVFYGSNAGLNVNADNSVIANLGANDINGTNDTDTLLMRAGQLTLKNGSVICSGNGSLVMDVSKDGVVTQDASLKVEVGTRFSAAFLGARSEIEWIDADGNAVDKSNVKIVLDPIGNSHYPYVSTTDTTVASYNYLGATKIDMFAMEFGAGRGNGNLYGWQAEKDIQIPSNMADFAGAFQGSAKNGAFTDVTYGGNTSFKFWISPINDLKMGDNRKLTADPYMIFGDVSSYSENSFAKVADTKVAIFEMDIATDSEYGFPVMYWQIGARQGGSGKTANSFLTLKPDGSFYNSKMKDFNSSIKLSLDKWNHVTFVVYTDASNLGEEADNFAGQTYVFINGELLGYYNAAYADGANYIQGARFNVSTSETHTVGQSILFDNFMRRAYSNYAEGTNEADGAAKSPASYLITDIPANTTPVNNNIIVNRFDYASIDAAKAAADAYNATSETTGIVETVELNGNITVPHNVNINTEVYHNGHTMNVDGASYGFAIDDDKYTFNENYQYNAKWYVGEIGNAEAMLDDANYVASTFKVGHVADRAAVWAEETANWNNFTVFTQNGWAYDPDSSVSVTPFVPTLADLENANQSAEAVAMYPSFGSIAMTAYLKDSTGNIAYYMNDEETTNAYHALKNGQTLVLLKDLTATKANAYFKSANAEQIVLGLDLNGYKFIYRHAGAVAWVGNNATLNVYSSRPGGHITSYYYDSGTNAPNSQRMFGIAPAVNTEGASHVANVNNAHINIGTFGDIPGSNMKISGGVLLEGVTGGETCSINMDGVLAECVRPTSGGILMARYYNGDINVTNSIFVYENTVHQLIDIKSYSGIYYTPTITIDGCTIMGASVVGAYDSNVINAPGAVAEGSNHKTIVIKNTISTKRINPTDFPTLIDRGDNVTAYKVAVGSNVVNYNAPITFESLGIPAELVANGYYEFVRPVIVDGQLTEETVYIVENGKSANAPEGATVVELYSVFEQKATTEQVNVNWKNFDGTNARVEKYAKGGYYENATSLDVDEYKLNAVKLVHNGTWTNIPEAGVLLTDNIDVNPGYTVESNLSGLKANLSLYSDFLVNLYIPADLAQYITAVNGEALAEGTVSFGEASFVKAIVAKSAKEASDDATFEIAIKEGEYTASKTVKISIADYAAQILAGDQFADTDKALMYYMLNYAAEAAEYLEGAADEEIAKLLADNVKWNVITVEKTFANAVENVGLDSIFTSSGITLDAAPAFTFTPNGKFTGTVTVTYGDGNVRTYTVSEGSTAKIVVEGMKIYNFGTNLTVTAVGTIAGVEGEQTVTGTINLDTYAKYHTENAENEESATKAESAEALDLINALYDYVKVAEQYKAGTLSIPNEGGEGEATPEPAPAE